jgi:RNA polymerase sigma factor (sigma-70 family)
MSAPGESIPHDENSPRATRSEKVAACNALRPEDYGRLLKFAELTARKFSGRVNDADAEDLMQEAIVRVLDERDIRNWYPQRADFLTFLRGCIKSIADSWYKRAKETESPDELISPTRHDAQTEAAITIERIRATLSARPHAVEIFDLKCQGLTAREIQERLRINEHIYAAAVKWIERTLRQGVSGND